MKKHDFGDCCFDASPCTGEPAQPQSPNGNNGRVADFAYAKRISNAPLNLQRQLQRWALLAAMVLFVGQTVVNAHLHFDAKEEQACALCAVSEPGQDPEVEWADAQPPVWCRAHAVPVFSTTLASRPYEARPSRAPPVS